MIAIYVFLAGMTACSTGVGGFYVLRNNCRADAIAGLSLAVMSAVFTAYFAITINNLITTT